MNVRKKGILPKKIKKLQKIASKKKAKDSSPSYKDSIDEVTVTAKAPTEAEKAGAKAFVEHDGVHRKWAYVEDAAGKDGSKGLNENWKKAHKLEVDTAKRLNVPTGPVRVGQEIKRYMTKRAWNRALKKAGYKK